MNRTSILDAVDRYAPPVAVAVLAGIAGTVGSYALAGFTPGFVAAPIAGYLARTLPGEVLTLAIVYLGSLGDQLNLVTAIGLAVAGLSVLAGVGRFVGRRLEQPLAGALLAFAGGGLFAFALTGRAVPSLGAAIGVGIVVGVAAVEWPSREPDTDPERREALRALATTVAVVVLGAGVRRTGVGSSGGGARTPAGSGPGNGGSASGAGSEPSGPVATLLEEAHQKSLPVAGLEPLVSERFYEVDINAVDPDLSASDWSLSITGAVDREQTVDYATLTGMEAEHQFVTLRCVGEQLNGHNMDNALWTGIPIARLLEDVEIQSDCGCVMLRAADDYYEEFPLEALQRGFLAWGMNGQDLPRSHGYPLRALIPGHWGEINVKWLTEIQFLAREATGFWEERGWHGTGPVNTVAKLHAVNHLDGGRIQVGGHAYAGTRGIQAVQVSTDGGTSWNQATLSEPLPGEDVWRQWMYEYDSPGSSHEVVVRAVDGTGALQPADQAGAYPNGPSGWVRQQVEA